MGWEALIPIAAQVVGAYGASKLGGKSSKWSGEQGKVHKLHNLLPQQEHLLKDLSKHTYAHLPNIQKDPNYQAGTGYLQNIISQNPEMMKQFEAPYMRQFSEQTVPGLAERFAGTDSMNSSAFQQALGSAGAGLQEQLAAMRANLGMNASQQLFGYSQLPQEQRAREYGLTGQRMGLALGTSPYSYYQTPGQAGMGQGVWKRRFLLVQ